MITYFIGRFAIDIPKQMILEYQGQTLRYISIEELEWPANLPREKARQHEWQRRLTAVSKLRPPRDKDRIILESRDVLDVGLWAKSILYFYTYTSSDEGRWVIIIDVGPAGLVLEVDGLLKYENLMFQDLLNVARAYTSRNPRVKLDGKGFFYTKNGAVNLPYLEKEWTFARFVGHPLGLTIRIETEQIYEREKKSHGLLGRVAAVLATGYNVGLDIDRIRSTKRTVAGLTGEEEVDRMTDEDGTRLSFAWRYSGEPHSGERPKILLRMESSDGHRSDKMRIWDLVIDSLKPAYK